MSTKKNMSNKLLTPTNFILDVDGVLTTGHFIYSSEGKAFKIFGPDDNDALSLLRKFIKINFITGDSKGYEISKKRIVFDMNYNLDLVSTTQRLEWIRERFNLKNVIYMGDGIFDGYVMQNVGYSIAPSNSYEDTKSVANYVTKCAGGERAVAEACIHILNNFFEPFDSIKPSSFLKFTKDKL